MSAPRVIVVMGVSGSGKSTIGSALAHHLGIPFVDGDGVHPPQNIAKMQAGIALNDTDRIPWLQHLHEIATQHLSHEGCVIACSALKEQYRNMLTQDIAHHCTWVLLEGTYEIIHARMQSRDGHYMPPELLKSQFDILEIPSYAFSISVELTPKEIVSRIVENLQLAEAGIIGLGVMGRNLALNIASNEITLALYNRHVSGSEEHVARDFVNTFLPDAKPFDALAPFVAALQRPRRILLMIDAGRAVDDVLNTLIPLLSRGDVIADCGNSHFNDTERRAAMLHVHGIFYLGTGISGGEKGARTGPAIMPGGDVDGYAITKPLLNAIAARDRNAQPCCSFTGSGGAGHFVKMVHNGIEYAEMQLIAETYGLLRHVQGNDPDMIATLFDEWNAGTQQSFLLEITAQILRRREGSGWLLDQISDAARSKGTGGWTLDAATALGMPSPVIAAAVHARFLSAHTEERSRADIFFHHNEKRDDILTGPTLHDALYLARLVNHHLGFLLLQRASAAYGWHLDLKEIARIWTSGCIIRSALMMRAQSILPDLVLHAANVVLDIEQMRIALHAAVITGAQHHLAMPCHSAALQFLNAYTTCQPVANLIQAQRDAFGAHGYTRKDDPSGRSHHTDWGV